MKITKNTQKIVSESLFIESEEAKEAGKLGYIARSLVQATIPHKNPGLVKIWGRRNGNFSMMMQPGYTIDKNNKPRCIGLPYGTKPRLVLAFICSEVIRNQNQEIVLGYSLSDFMRQLGLTPTGGRWGTIPMLKDQIKRLLSATVSFQYEDDNEELEINYGFKIATRTLFFWNPKSPSQAALWESTLTLSNEFYKEIMECSVPIDMRVLSALKTSSMALDIYCWLTYRMSYLKKPTSIPWELLVTQFGADYSEARDFKKNFLKQLKKVLLFYKVNISESEKGLQLKPSKTHIPMMNVHNPVS